MVMVIQHIDAIACEKQRDVLYLEFHPQGADSDGVRKAQYYDYKNDPVRTRILEGLDALGVPWMMCGEYADVRRLPAYHGQIYLDVPHDEENEMYCRLRDFLEHPDGSIKHEGVRFHGLYLEHAMKNADHDKPGFWEEWAETF